MTLLIKQKRLKRGWTLEFVAEQIGVTKSAVHDMETGRRKPSYEVLLKLLQLFKCKDPRDLFGAATPDNEDI